MRVVGGKTGADGRLFAYIVWTVPGGPAEKYGLQQGDKVSHLLVYNEVDLWKGALIAFSFNWFLLFISAVLKHKPCFL